MRNKLSIHIVFLFSVLLLPSCAVLNAPKVQASLTKKVDSLQKALYISQQQVEKSAGLVQQLKSDTALLLKKQLGLAHQNSLLQQKMISTTGSAFSQIDLLSDDIEAREQKLRKLDDFTNRGAERLAAIYQVLESNLAQIASHKGVSLFKNNAQVVITFTDTTLFSKNDTLMNKRYQPFLLQMAELLRKESDLVIKVVGYTDNDTKVSPMAHNLWGWSAFKAAQVHSFLVHKGNIPLNSIQVIGAGDSNPVAANDFPPGRSLNRRIEIVLQNSDKNLNEILNN